MKFVSQLVKHLFVGGFATIIDLIFFKVFIFFLPGFLIIPKSVSFLIATSLKYLGNKYWAFEKYEKEKIIKEFLQFFAVTLVGLIFDVGSFLYFTKIMPWTELNVIFAAAVAAVWNFTAYKFLVFKK